MAIANTNNNLIRPGYQAPPRSNTANLQRPGYGQQGGAQPPAGRTYTLSTGSKQYTLSQEQYDWVKKAHKASWADAYAFDDEDQQRRASGLVPRAYAQHYKNTKLDNWLLENDLPSAQYLEPYLESFGQYDTERTIAAGLSQRLDAFSRQVAMNILDYERQGITIDSSSDEWADAFYDELDKPEWADIRKLYSSTREVDEEDYSDKPRSEYRDAQLKSALAGEKDSWDGPEWQYVQTPSLSFDEFNAKSGEYVKQIKTMKLVDGMFANVTAQELAAEVGGDTFGDLLEYQRKAAQTEEMGALDSKEKAQKYMEERLIRGDNAIDILEDMASGGLSLNRIRQAKNEAVNRASKNEKQAIKDWYAEYNKSVEREYIPNKEKIKTGAAAIKENNADTKWLRDTINGYEVGETSGISKAEAKKIFLDNIERGSDGYIIPESATNAVELIRASGATPGVIGEAVIDALRTDRVLGRVPNEGLSNPYGITASWAIREEKAMSMSGSLDFWETFYEQMNEYSMQDEYDIYGAMREKALLSGMSVFELDNAMRRVGKEDYIPKEIAAEDYFIEKAAEWSLPNGYTSMTQEERTQYGMTKWEGMTDDERAGFIDEYDKTERYNTDIHKSVGQMAAGAATRTFGLSLYEIYAGAVGAADMIFRGDREEPWQYTQDVMEEKAKLQTLALGGENQGNGSLLINTAGEIGKELIRMYATNFVGQAFSKPFSTLMSKIAPAQAAAVAAGTASRGTQLLINALPDIAQKTPFVFSAMGNSYLEAVEAGATLEEATSYGVVTGLMEGVIESFNVDLWTGRLMGSKKLGDALVKANTQVMRSGILNKMTLGRFASSFLGEAIEESGSYLVSLGMKRATYDPNAQFDGQELLQQGLFGGILGIFGAGMSGLSGASANTIVEYMKRKGATLNNSDLLASAIWTASKTEDELKTLSQNAALLSKKEWDSLQVDMRNTANQRDERMAAHPANLAKIDADLRAKQDAVDSLSRQYVSTPTEKVGKSLNLAIAELAREKADAEKKRIAENKSYNEVMQQHQDNAEKRKADMEAHWIALYNLFQPEIAAMDELNQSQERQVRLAATGALTDAAYLRNIDDEFAFTDEQYAEIDNLISELNRDYSFERADVVAESEATLAEMPNKMAAARAGTHEAYAERKVREAEARQAASEQAAAADGEQQDVPRVALSMDDQNAVIRLGQEMGRTVEFEELGENENGYWDAEQQKIVLNINQKDLGSGTLITDTARAVLTHEITHSLEGTEAYNALAEFVIRQYEERGVDVPSLYAGIRADYAGRIDNDGAARREAVASYVQSELFTSEESIQKLVREQSGVAGRFLNWLEYQIAKTKARIGKKNTAKLALIEAERLYVKAFSKAGVKPSDAMREYSVGRTTSGELVAVVDTDILDGVPERDWIPTVVAELKARYPDGITIGSDQIQINKQSRNELTRSRESQYIFSNDKGMFADKMNAAVNADDVLTASGNYISEPPRHPRKDDITDFSRGNVLLRIGQNDYTADVVLGHTNRDTLLLYDIVNMKKAKHTLRLYSAGSTHAGFTQTTSAVDDGDRYAEPRTDSMPSGQGVVNSEFSEADAAGELASTRQYSIPDMTFEQLVEKYGAQPQGRDPRARDIEVPNRIADGRRVSRFARSVLESEQISDEELPEYKRLLVSGDFGAYVPVSNVQTLEEADEYIARKGGLAAAQREFLTDVAEGKVTTKNARRTVATGEILMTEAWERGDSASWSDLFSSLKLLGAEVGQAVQIYGAMKDMEGQGQAYYAVKMVDRINAKYADRINSGKMQEIILDTALLDDLASARTEDEVENAERAVWRYVGERTPLTRAQAFRNYRYFSMLANPKTHVRNVTGNLFMSMLTRAKDFTATGMEWARVKSGKMTQEDRRHAAYLPWEQKERMDFARSMYDRYRRDVEAGGKYEFDSEVYEYMRQSNIKVLNWAMKGNSALLSDIEDVRWFQRPAFVRAFTQYMVAQNIDPNAITARQEAEGAKWAIDEAQRATFREPNRVASALTQFSNINKVTEVLVEGLIPFRKTPMNVLKRGLEYAPVLGIINGAKMLAVDVKKGKVSAATAIDRLAAGTVGTVMGGIGALLAALGILRGGSDENETYENYLSTAGEQPYSLNIGDYSVSLSNVAPAAMPLFLGVSVYELISEDEDFNFADFMEAFIGIADPFMDMSFMSNMNEALSTGYSGNSFIGNAAASATKSYASQFLPSLPSNIVQFADPTVRTAKASKASDLGSETDYFLRSQAKKTPAGPFVLEPLVDVYGRVVEKNSFEDWAIDFFNKFVSPGTIKVKNRDLIDREIIRVYEATGNTDMLPAMPQKYVTYNKVQYDMTAKQYTQYTEEYGQAVYSAIKALIVTSRYKNADAEKQAAMLKKSIENAESSVRDLWKIKLSGD